MKKRDLTSFHLAFTIVELVFVLVLIGILSAVGSSMFKANHLRDDVNFISLKITQAQYQGIGYDHYKQESDTTIGCIDLNKEKLEENTTNGKSNYHIFSTLSGDLNNKKLCFDRLGRPHDGNFTNDSLFLVQKMLILDHDGQEINITVYPKTGYVIIR